MLALFLIGVLNLTPMNKLVCQKIFSDTVKGKPAVCAYIDTILMGEKVPAGYLVVDTLKEVRFSDGKESFVFNRDINSGFALFLKYMELSQNIEYKKFIDVFGLKVGVVKDKNGKEVK